MVTVTLAFFMAPSNSTPDCSNPGTDEHPSEITTMSEAGRPFGHLRADRTVSRQLRLRQDYWGTGCRSFCELSKANVGAGTHPASKSRAV